MTLPRLLVPLLAASGLLVATPAAADPRRDAIVAGLLEQAKKEDAGVRAFSAERGAAFYRATHQGKSGASSCASCHGQAPQEKGQTRLGKAIEPMAVSRNAERYTDAANVEKWFLRNCGDVLGRACTAKEKGDFIAFMAGQ
jgi:cytochrome c553